MRFIPNGPDIPHSLINAHEEGRVVFLDHNYFGLSADLSVIEGLELLKEIIHTTGE